MHSVSSSKPLVKLEGLETYKDSGQVSQGQKGGGAEPLNVAKLSVRTHLLSVKFVICQQIR